MQFMDYLEQRIAFLEAEKLRIEGSIAELRKLQAVAVPAEEPPPNRATRRRAAKE